MNNVEKEIHKISPYTEIDPRAQSCTHCGSYTRPKLITHQVPAANTTVTEAHYICPRCNNRFMIGRVRK